MPQMGETVIQVYVQSMACGVTGQDSLHAANLVETVLLRGLVPVSTFQLVHHKERHVPDSPQKVYRVILQNARRMQCGVYGLTGAHVQPVAIMGHKAETESAHGLVVSMATIAQEIKVKHRYATRLHAQLMVNGGSGKPGALARPRVILVPEYALGNVSSIALCHVENNALAQIKKATFA